MSTVQDRFRLSYRIAETGCWAWIRSLNHGGYGSFTWLGKRMGAHRAAYELLIGPIPPGLDLDHLCRNRACVNPAHLEPVTRSVNLRRGDVGGQSRFNTHCIHGHEFTPENTYRRPKDGGRHCRECMRSARLRYYHRQKATA